MLHGQLQQSKVPATHLLSLLNDYLAVSLAACFTVTIMIFKKLDHNY